MLKRYSEHPRPKNIGRSFILAALSLFFAVIIVMNGSPAYRANALPPGSDTLTILMNTIVPQRDAVDLARRFLGVATVPPTPATPKVYNVGDQAQFYAVDNDENKDFTVTAQLWAATPHVYIWFEVGVTPDKNAVMRSAENFENNIYPTVHRYFGSEASPGVDNDVHLYILNLRNIGRTILGYFDSRSQYPALIVPNSNEHQMFYMSADNISNQIGTPAYDTILAHEFQHMVHANIDGNESEWLDEGLAELSSALAGDNSTGYIGTFLSRPYTQLNTWSADDSIPNYGASFAFTAYFLERYGEDGLHKLVSDPANGFEGFRSALKSLNATDPVTGKPVTVESFFADWTVANLLNDTAIGDGRYGYKRFAGKLDTPQQIAATIGSPKTIQGSQWGTTYITLDQAGTYKFKFEGQPTVKVVPVDPFGGKRAWWSTSEDRSDTKLTHEFDLTSVQKATLNFDIWYTIEPDWDYGYLSASTDGGNTWTALSTAHSVPNGGHNNPYGAAFNAYSGGGDNPSDAKWLSESVDLSAYAGKKVLIRFEYLTDDAVAERGMLIDNLAIPEIGYSTDAETDDGGWKAEGWARIENVLPQRYVVQLIEYGKSPKVTQLIAPDGATRDNTDGEWTITVGKDVPKVVIAVSGLTEFTTEPAPFTYTLTPVQ